MGESQEKLIRRQSNPMASPEPQQEHCRIIEINEAWVNSLKEKADDAYQNCQARERTIFRVPPYIRKQDPDAYEPQTISLGPYYRRKPCLQAVNELKLYFLSLFLRRNPCVALQDYLKELKTLEEKARSSYSEDIDMESNEFVEMLLLDGCFVVEFLLRSVEDSHRHPFFKTLGALNRIVNDMLMLENQLPFFVLESIFDLTIRRETEQSIFFKDLAFVLYKCLFPSGVRMPSGEPVPRFHHLLHFLHSCLAPAPAPALEESVPWFHLLLHFLHSCIAPTQHQQQENAQSSTRTPESIPCAILLAEAGVKFRTAEEEDKSFLKCMKIKEAFKKVIKKASNPELSASSTERVQEQEAKSLLDITFVNGVLSIPTLKIYDQTNLFFRNLIVLEQCFPDVGNHVGAYLEFMDFIIDTPMDVTLLRQKKVIVNYLGNDENVAALFNNLCKEVVSNTGTGYLSDVLVKVTRHCDSSWHRYRRKLMRDYFNSPWATLSLVAAMILLLLTAIQAVFSVLPYFKPPK